MHFFKEGGVPINSDYHALFKLAKGDLRHGKDNSLGEDMKTKSHLLSLRSGIE